MTKLDDRTMEDMSKLMLDRTTTSLFSVLQLIPDPMQRAEMIMMMGTLCTGLASKILLDAFTADTGNTTTSYDTFVLFICEKMHEAAIEMGANVEELNELITTHATAH